ncbi:MAG: hypothetical protein ACI8W8_002127 [Rhodothermales bacterium]|jgi:hypothetical protein
MNSDRRHILLALVALLAAIWMLWPAASERRTPPESATFLTQPATESAGPADSTDAAPLRKRRVRSRRPTAPVDRRAVIANEFIVTFPEARALEHFLGAVRANGGRVLGRIDRWGQGRVKMSDDSFRKLRQRFPDMLQHGANYRVSVPPVPAEDELEVAEHRGFGGSALDWLGVPADNAEWGEGVTIALLDTRVLEHDSLGDAKVTRVDLLEASVASDDAVGHVGHATAIASVLVGAGDVAGIVPSAELLGIRVLEDDGTGDTFTIAQGILEAIDRGADVINLSLGTYADSPVLRAAVNAALEAGVSVVAAVGNDAYAEVTYPARYDGVIAVTGVDANEQMLNFANEGLIDVAAPGYGVHTAWTEEGLVSFNGTSIASPFVAGAIAAQLAANSQLTAVDAEALVLEYVNDTGAPGPDPDFGQGILNIARIEERNVPGLYDMAVAGFHLADGSLHVSAQNRGTEPVSGVSMAVSIDGDRHDFQLGELGIGETASRKLALVIAESATVDLRAQVEVASETDLKPANDRRALSIENGAN